VGAGTVVSSTGGRKGVRSNGVSILREARKTNAPATAMAIHEQQTRIARIAPMILGVDEDGFVLVSMNMDLLDGFVHLTLN
jgi:hypothetical protein